MTGTAARRESQRERLIDAAERAIAEKGLAGLKARELAREIGCSLGAIYNLVADMDELILRVGSRTLARLDAALSAAPKPAASQAEAVEALVAVALAYSAFARENLRLWRVLFEHRMAEGAVMPDWAVSEQMTLFRHILGPLRLLAPERDEEERNLLGRTLFSAVHGVVAIGLEEKLVAVPRRALDRQIEELVRLACRGLAAGA
ncbi:TetR/AcrR family transcriptional regulator [Bosea sp. (in: a-proteobacteria)]|uniref:TetR/AcrR family transcriptional regulator n=1 Tax=Bosea sp. (in: a-proteobacteria) TaxID=1871050 RepID=UPI002616668C|nr:TetR/AcrR family transcriptional regulator [Bosea sp. (in: a-proteobacteria)]MCO5089957.1 TetR/AcrR family transcriptional regulator [Bosea sp. (in: a-proteobacteria)]